MKSPFLALLALVLPLSLSAAEPWKTIDLWTDQPPNEKDQKIGNETWKAISEDGDPNITRLSNVSKPRMAIYPARGKGPKPTVLVFPGGGYSILAMKHEGTMVAEWLNDIGFTAIVVTYRVPRREGREPHEAPLEDARRALRLAHNNAAEWNLNPDQIGVLGFSAGGNLAAHTAFGFEVGNLDKEQQVDFAVLVYPAYLIEDSGEIQKGLRITKKSPPTFLVHAHDDRKAAHVDGSVRLYLELSARDILAELHVFSQGGHGYGMLDRGLPVNQWPDLCADWLKLVTAPK